MNEASGTMQIARREMARGRSYSFSEAASMLLSVNDPVTAPVTALKPDHSLDSVLNDDISTAETLLQIVSPVLRPMSPSNRPAIVSLNLNLLMETSLENKATSIRCCAVDKQTTRVQAIAGREGVDNSGAIGRFTPAARKLLLEKFHSKRARRRWKKKVMYKCRSELADVRIRIKGRFVPKHKWKAGAAAAIALQAGAAAMRAATRAVLLVMDASAAGADQATCAERAHAIGGYQTADVTTEGVANVITTQSTSRAPSTSVRIVVDTNIGIIEGRRAFTNVAEAMAFMAKMNTVAATEDTPPVEAGTKRKRVDKLSDGEELRAMARRCARTRAC
jgi:hypothetical protein